MVARFAHDGRPEGPLLAVLLIGTFACAYATKSLGVHPVFGAFLFGAALPRDDRLLDALIERVEYIAIIVLMPVFFALAGLNTTPSAFVGTGLSALLIVLVAAVAGKVLGGAAGARIAGYPWRTAFAVGSLMNARALMELIVMKVGLDAGVIGNDLFTMLMVMAILTTFMTGPLLTLFAGKRRCSGAGGDRDRRAPLSQQPARVRDAELVLPRRVAVVQAPGLDHQFALEVLDEIAAERDVPQRHQQPGLRALAARLRGEPAVHGHRLRSVFAQVDRAQARPAGERVGRDRDAWWSRP